jgi:hypothetical protein
MNTIRATVFLLALSLSGGCASFAPEGLDLDCEGRPVKVIRISYKRHDNIKVRDPIVNVNRGEAINYKVTGPQNTQNRTFNAKGTSGPSSFGWLDKVNGSGGPGGISNFICVPDDQIEGDYNYEIEIVGVGKLDPTVHVNR